MTRVAWLTEMRRVYEDKGDLFRVSDSAVYLTKTGGLAAGTTMVGRCSRHDRQEVDVREAPTDLPAVLREIAAALLASDWTRYSDDSGHFYYVIRESDRAREIESLRTFPHMAVFKTEPPGYFEDWYIRAVLATDTPDYMAKARTALARSGVDLGISDEVALALKARDSRAALTEVLERWVPQMIADDRLEAILAVLGAIRVVQTRSGELPFSESNRPDLRRALEAKFLKELTERFPKIVERAATFDWLSFADGQIREASRCYLYGFFRATVVIAAAAVEKRLKGIARIAWLESYEALISAVYGPAGTQGEDRARAGVLNDLFALRNLIVHQGHEPQAEEATKALDSAREVLDSLAEVP
jgi:hypothetical protein